MDENGSPRHIQAPEVLYNRLSTLEMENQALSMPEEEPDSAIQYLFDICQVVDWDRLFMAAFVTISLVLILTASFFLILKSGLMTDQLQIQHRFLLDSLTISHFNASSSQVTGKCDVVLNITNLGDRSLYHENAVLSIFLDHELLWVVRTGGFFIEVGDKIMFNVSMNTTSVSVPASFVPTALLESREFGRMLRFKLKYDGMVRAGLDTWHEER